jgi:SOS-response transcriptional repressor LexA
MGEGVNFKQLPVMRGVESKYLPGTLTPRQRAVVEAILASVSERGYPPTLREMMETFGLKSTNGIHDHLLALRRKGIIEWDGGSRGIKLVGVRWEMVLLDVKPTPTEDP